jgi:glyoxylase I family protein
VNDLRTSVEFYEDVLGFDRQYEYENVSEGWTRIGLSIGDFLVELFSPKPESKAGLEIDPFYPMSWGRPKIALTVSNVEAAYSQVVAAQIPVLCPIVLTAVSKFFFVTDPDGTAIQLHEFLKGEARVTELRRGR